MAKEVIIIGAGGHSRVITDIVQKSGDKVIGYLDDFVQGEQIIGKTQDCLRYLDKAFIIGIGNNFVRKDIVAQYPNLDYYTAVHPCAVIAKNAQIGKGSCIMANAVVNACAKIGMHCIINTAAVVEHDDRIEDYVHISPNAALGGTVHVGAMTHIGIGATVLNNIDICDNCIVGAGAVVTKSIDAKGTYIGIPAKKNK